MPGGSVTKIGRTYKKWTYIARKRNNSQKSSTHNSRKNSVSHKISQYITIATNRIQGTIINNSLLLKVFVVLLLIHSNIGH
jgi:hypothetical protein